jgi:uncharacterized OsmC-like protein
MFPSPVVVHEVQAIEPADAPAVDDAGALRHDHPTPPVLLMEVTAEAGRPTRADGVLWNGTLNATPADSPEGQLPIESLMAALGGCLVRNLCSAAADDAIPLERVELRLAATRSDDPPSIATLRAEIAIEADAPPERVCHAVERSIRFGTITRTLARACELDIHVSHVGAPLALDVEAFLTTNSTEERT